MLIAAARKQACKCLNAQQQFIYQFQLSLPSAMSHDDAVLDTIPTLQVSRSIPCARSDRERMFII